MERERDASSAIDKALDVLFHLSAQAEPKGVSDIGRALSLPKSSAHRLLGALLRRGLVERDERGRYRPGIGLLSLALGVLDREPLIAAGHGVLEEEAAAFGETFFLVAARSGRLVVLEKVEGTGFLRASPSVGSEVPVHASAVGKLYLAHAPELLQLGESQQRFTQKTLVGEQRLRREVEETRKRGYAANRGEWIEGLSVLAAPVFAHGTVAGAVCTAMPTQRFTKLDEQHVVQRLKAAAARIGGRLAGGRAA